MNGWSAGIAVIALLQFASCDMPRSASIETVDAREVLDPPTDIAGSEDTRLHLVRGMTGLIPQGDELMVMVYGAGSREALIRQQNVSAAKSSLDHWLQGAGPVERRREGGLLRVPDVHDPGGSRFYYFESKGPGEEWEFRATCAGAWDNNPEWPSICDLSYVAGRSVVSMEIEEDSMVANHAKIRCKVMSRLSAANVVR